MDTPAPPLATFPVLGIPIHLADNYQSWLLNRLHQRLGTHVVTLNSEMTMVARQNPELASIIRQAELVVPDGAGVVLYLRLFQRRIQRCPGIELVESLLQSMGPQCSVFCFGGAPGVAQGAMDHWCQRVPDLAIAGVEHGYLAPGDQDPFLERLQTLQPNLILVGLGVPRQEFWIAQHRHLCPQATWVGVGGSFDIWAGTKERAPGWLRNNHLEWTYRLYQEPWRWRRMLALPKFAGLALWARLTQGGNP